MRLILRDSPIITWFGEATASAEEQLKSIEVASKSI